MREAIAESEKGLICLEGETAPRMLRRSRSGQKRTSGLGARATLAFAVYRKGRGHRCDARVTRAARAVGTGRSMPTKARAGVKEKVAVLTLVKTCANVVWLEAQGGEVYLAAGVARWGRASEGASGHGRVPCPSSARPLGLTVKSPCPKLEGGCACRASVHQLFLSALARSIPFPSTGALPDG